MRYNSIYFYHFWTFIRFDCFVILFIATPFLSQRHFLAAGGNYIDNHNYKNSVIAHHLSDKQFYAKDIMK
jgi:hypothetical protein